MSLTKKDVLNIEKRLEMYDKVFEKIFQRFDVLDKELKIRNKKRKKTVKNEYGENDKIYLSIAGLCRAAMVKDN